jgi:hypothetical protein
MRPADHCPYVKPFPADFADCIAYQPVRFIPISSNFKPLTPIHTCRHLSSRRVEGQSGRWYPACSLGALADRRAWVEAVDPSRLATIGRLRQEMADLNALFIDQLWVLKSRQLEARRDHRDDTAIRQEMQQTGDRFVEQTRQFLTAHQQSLREIDVTMDAIIHLLHLSLERLIARSSGEVRWEVPEEALSQFSPPVRLFFRPPSAESAIPAIVE